MTWKPALPVAGFSASRSASANCCASGSARAFEFLDGQQLVRRQVDGGRFEYRNPDPRNGGAAGNAGRGDEGKDGEWKALHGSNLPQSSRPMIHGYLSQLPAGFVPTVAWRGRWRVAATTPSYRPLTAASGLPYSRASCTGCGSHSCCVARPVT